MDPHFVSEKEAVARLGISRNSFRQLLGLDPLPKGQQPGEMMLSVRRWFRSHKGATATRLYALEDVDALARVMAGWQDGPPADSGAGLEDEEDEEG